MLTFTIIVIMLTTIITIINILTIIGSISMTTSYTMVTTNMHINVSIGLIRTWAAGLAGRALQ